MVISIFFVFVQAILSFLICLAAARHLHNKIFKSILRSPVLFFDINPVGMYVCFKAQVIYCIGCKLHWAKLCSKGIHS